MKAVITALVTLTLILVSQAQAQEVKVLNEMKDGGKYYLYRQTNPKDRIILKIEELKDGFAFVKFYDENGNAAGYLTAADSNEGTVCNITGMPKTHKWYLNPNSYGWNFVHPDNRANAVAFKGIDKKTGAGTVTGMALRRNNGGGNGNQDQIFRLEFIE